MRKLVASVVIPVVAGVLTAAVPGLSPVPRCALQLAQDWVAANLASLPSTLDALSKYPDAYRRAIYHTLPRATQIRMWREQFAYYESSSALSTEQKALVLEVDGAWDAYFGRDTVTTRDADAFEIRYKARAIDVLGGPLARQVLANLGVHTPDTDANKALSAAGGDCSCSMHSDLVCFRHEMRRRGVQRGRLARMRYWIRLPL